MSRNVRKLSRGSQLGLAGEMFGFFSRKKPAAASGAAGAGAAPSRPGRGSSRGRSGGADKKSRSSKGNDRFQHRDAEAATKFYDALAADTTFADAEIVAGGGEPIPFHSFVISSRSKIMATMLASAKRGPSGRMRLEVRQFALQPGARCLPSPCAHRELPRPSAAICTFLALLPHATIAMRAVRH